MSARVAQLMSPVIFFSPLEQSITVSQDGSFSTDIALETGDNQITLALVDKAGNISEQVLNITKVATTVDNPGAEVSDSGSENSDDLANSSSTNQGLGQTAINSNSSNLPPGDKPVPVSTENIQEKTKEAVETIEKVYHKESKNIVANIVAIGTIIILSIIVINKRKIKTS